LPGCFFTFAGLTASVVAGLAQCASAQLTDSSSTNAGVTNAIHKWTAEDYKRLQKEAADAVARSTNVQRKPSKEELEWAAGMAASYSAKPWPEAAQKQVTLQRCAAILRSAVNTNEIELACRQLTNSPETVVALKNLAVAATSNLDECATVLASPDLKTTIGDFYLAELWAPSNYFSFVFWTTNKLPTVIRTVDKRTPDGTAVIMLARFYESGKLELLEMVPRDNKGAITGSEGLSFKEDGKLDRHWIEPN
jgi:hypothetical protein